MEPSRSLSLDELLTHVDWIRALSRQLVRDPDLADDILQETLVRASLDEGPRQEGALRAWLGALVRNFARSGLRARVRRRHHEELAARPEGLPSTHEVVERAALHQELVEFVMELAEPYRTTVLLRFFEALSTREIAQHLNQPEATVRTHLARGLALLRARLDRRHGGDRTAWALLAAPIPATSVPVVTTLLAMNVKLALAVPAVCAAALVWYLGRDGSHAPSGPLAAAENEGGRVELQAPRIELEPGAVREPAPGAPATEVVTGATGPAVLAERFLLGQVIDVDSRPVPEARIVLVPNSGAASEALATSDGEGKFELSRPARAAHLEVADEGWYTLYAGLVGSNADQRACAIVVAPSAPFQGVVVDEAGLPLAGAEVSIEPQFSLRTRFTESIDTSENMPAQARSDAAGRFGFERAPRCEGLNLEVELAGYVSYFAPFLETDRPFKTIQLSRTGQAREVLRGRVVDEGGSPLAEAVVAVGLRTTLTDSRGEFAIARSAQYDIESAVPELRALLPGRLPAVFVPELIDGVPQWPSFVTLQLGGKPLSLRGRVERSDGRPLAGARVWLTDTTTFGEGPGGTLQLEGWLAGDTENAWHFATSAADGSFELGGLLEREYTLCAVDPATLERTTLPQVAAGRSGVVLRFLESDVWGTIQGVVHDSEGVPISEVRVEPTTTAFLASFAGRRLFSQSMKLEGVLTDAQGRFTLERVPRGDVVLALSGDSVLGKEWELDPAVLEGDPVSPVQIELERRMHVQVELADPTSANSFALLDADGNEISMSLRMGSSTYFMTRTPIVEGRSHVASGSERARSVVIYKDDEEVGRTSVMLSPDEITTVRL